MHFKRMSILKGFWSGGKEKHPPWNFAQVHQRNFLPSEHLGQSPTKGLLTRSLLSGRMPLGLWTQSHSNVLRGEVQFRLRWCLLEKHSQCNQETSTPMFCSTSSPISVLLINTCPRSAGVKAVLHQPSDFERGIVSNLLIGWTLITHHRPGTQKPPDTRTVLSLRMSLWWTFHQSDGSCPSHLHFTLHCCTVYVRIFLYTFGLYIYIVLS